MKISTTRDRTQGKITLPSVWRGTVLRVAAVLFWILLWAVAAHKVGLPVLLPSPLSVAQRLVQLCVTADFWMTVFASLVRILLGFFCGVLFGTLLAVMAWRSDIAQEMIRPMLGVLKATPVASFIILALVWIDTQILAAVISFIMVLPLVYHNVREGFDAADTKLLEMARMFELSGAQTFRFRRFCRFSFRRSAVRWDLPGNRELPPKYWADRQEQSASRSMIPRSIWKRWIYLHGPSW